MKYERKERSLEETIEFFKAIGWSIGGPEKDLLIGVIGPDIYLTYYDHDSELTAKANKVIDFFFKKVEKFEEGQWCWFWDDNFSGGSMGKYNKKDGYYYQKGCASGFINCISIKEFRNRLKEYL